MDFENVNWAQFGLIVIGICVAVFAWFVYRRQWSIGALLVGVLHLPLAFINAAAPFRGALDPSYVGYSLGLVRAEAGIEVALFAGALLFGAMLSACIAVLNRPGARNYFIVAFDAFLMLILLPPMLAGFAGAGDTTFRVEFGEYLQFGGVPAMLFQVVLMLTPLVVGIVWGFRRAK